MGHPTHHHQINYVEFAATVRRSFTPVLLAGVFRTMGRITLALTRRAPVSMAASAKLRQARVAQMELRSLCFTPPILNPRKLQSSAPEEKL